MNNLEKFLEKIEQVTAPAQKINHHLNQTMLPYIQKIDETIGPIARDFQRTLKAHHPFLDQIATTLAKITEAAQCWQQARKADISVMAESGWYPNWFTFFYTPETEPQSVDELMSMHLNADWEDITQRIIELCPNRAHILEAAFSLHKSGAYIAAIPLFLAQADGVCCESLKSFLFTGNDTEEKIKKLIENGKIEANMFTDVFLEPFKLKNHHNAGISKSSAQAKSKAPNRNGIMHGHRNHLDYGTEINSLKCFSLLSFIAYSTKEIIGKK
ncbi:MULTISPECIES: hypothetical protein [unclassified Pseudomonas]|uniref:hypothetical protein n=1 Tax=unclassified Pseudomonas TaxID=196821 RepID=UPI0011B46958|nr:MULTISPECIES: hypothetical protein [unclassified Pseudomonas]